MKKAIFLVVAMMACLSTTNTVKAQEAPTLSREIYLYGRFLDFNNLALEYKTELSEGRFFRIGINRLHFGLSRSTSSPDNQAFRLTTTDIGGRVEIGWERRKQITHNLSSFFGINLFATATYERYKTEQITDNIFLSPGLSFSSGVILNISGPFSIAAVFAPELSVFYSSDNYVNEAGERSTHRENHGVSLNINNHLFRIGLIYRWDK